MTRAQQQHILRFYHKHNSSSHLQHTHTHPQEYNSYTREDALAAALSKIAVLEQQVTLVADLQEITDEQDALITQLKGMLEAKGNEQRAQVRVF